MVLKTLFASAIEEEEEEDVYLRKCNIRKSKRQNEKSRKIALQTNEALSLERVPSPLPLSTIRSGSVGKSPARKERPYTSPYFPPKSRTNSTDDVYPQPSPPPRSPSFGSPVALGRTLALSLSLFSPGGFTISASGGANAYSGRKSQSHNALSSMRSPEYVGIQKAHSTDSNGSWGEIVEIGSPHSHQSPHSPHRSPNQSPNSDHKRISNAASASSPNHTASGGSAANKTPLREEYYHDGEHNAHLRDSNRVKQFLFHRDRNRARKAQLLYPSGTYGNSCEFSPDLDEHRCNNIANSPDTKNRADRKISSPGNKNRRSGSFGNSGGSGGSGKHTRKYSDERNIKVDVDIDTRSGSVGNASMLSPHGVRRASFRVDSPTTPFASASGGAGDEHNSPYYRALTLGARTSPVHAGLPMRKDVRSASVSSVGSAGSAGSSADSVVSTSPTTSSTAVHAIAYEDTYVRRRRDSITCDSPVSSNERSAEIYETLFPALPVGLVKTTSNLGSVVDSVLSSAVIKEMDGVCGASVRDTELYVPKVVVPTVPVYSTEQVCSMFYTAVVHAGLVANNMPTDTATNTTTINTANATTHTSTSAGANTTRYRAWDDADSSDDESTSDNSFMSDSTNTTSTSVAAIHQQVQKLTEIDATCGSLIQKCDYIYDTIKTKVPYKFDREYVNMIVVPFVVSHHTATSADAPNTSTSNNSPVLSIAELFTHYVQCRLVYQLVQLLQYEDTRFESNRLPLLYVLYKGSSTTSVSSTTTSSVSVRTKIAQAIEHTTSERVSRCKQLLYSATASEMDVNFISKSGFSELVANSPTNSTSTPNATNILLPLTAVATSCDITAIIQSENERSTYKTKDSEVTIIELMKFIISHEIGELLVYDSNSSNSGSGGGSGGRGCVVQRNSESRVVLMCIVRAYCSLFRCYTYKLGAHYAGGSDSVEQPVLLEYLTQLLDGILAWAKVLYNSVASTTDTVMYGGSANNSPDRSSSKRKLRSAATTPTSASTANNTNSTESVLEEVCECILHSTYKHWTNKLNYAQDVAYLLQCEVILTIYTPTTSTSTASNTGLLYSAVFASTNRSDNTKKAVLPPLLPHSTTSNTTTNACVVQKILYKMLTRVCSQHVKVATQAMQSIQSPILMVRYFLPRMTTAMVSYIFGTEVGRTTFMSGPGWENSRREECLNLLVDKLRDCRNVYLNFSTQLQISSTQLLDTTLELLQVIEDAE